MSVSLVSERYAKALFDLALEKGAEEEVFHDSRLILKTCDDSKDLRLLLKSPIINSGKKLTIIREIFTNHVSQITLTYLLIMVRKNRESYIPEIAGQFIELHQEYHNILTVYFKSPVSPDEKTRKQVLDLMIQYTKADIDLKTQIDESLVGGFVLHWKDLQYDASIRREIENMRNSIAKINLYKKGF